jgi:hypothetical protein
LFISCAIIPFDRLAMAWKAFQIGGAPIQCISATNCTNFEAQCNLDSSTQCSGWNPVLKQGFYAP